MKEVEQIINEIQLKIGQKTYGEQVKYISKKIEEYASHPDAKEIEKECYKLIGELMPSDYKESINEQLNHEVNRITEKLNYARELISKEEYMTAVNLTSSLSQMADRRPVFENDGKSAYFNFSEEFEKVIYLEIERQKGRNVEDCLKETNFPYYDIYVLNGTCLFEIGQYREAMDEFNKASYWNPASAFARLQYIMAFFKIKEGENAWSLLVDTMKYLFRRQDIAQCYFCFALCYLAGGEIEAAIACFLLHNHYAANNNSIIDFQEIMEEMGVQPSYFTKEVMCKLAETYRFPLNPEKPVIKLANETGNAIMDTDPELAYYYFRIARLLSDVSESGSRDILS